MENICRYSTDKDLNQKRCAANLSPLDLNKLKYLQPAKWTKPSNGHDSDGYVCLIEICKYDRSANSFKYLDKPTCVIQPVLNSVRAEPNQDTLEINCHRLFD